VSSSKQAQQKRTFRCSNWTVWFTGLSGAGKSTLATELGSYLSELSLAFEILDGDALRRELCSDLGYSREHRDENVRRISYIAQLLNRHNIIAVVAAISPYRQARLDARNRCPAFVEVHVDCSIDTLICRDTKGLYAQALQGNIKHFTGISDLYEAPLRPEIYINSGLQSETESFEFLLSGLVELGLLPGAAPHFGREKLSSAGGSVTGWELRE
jgi:adenylylsulfate kinase